MAERIERLYVVVAERASGRRRVEHKDEDGAKEADAGSGKNSLKLRHQESTA